MARARIAHVAGPTATALNTPPLITAESIPVDAPRAGTAEGWERFDALRPQRLAAAAVVYVEQFSAHPLERHHSDLYGPPDGYIEDGEFATEKTSDDAVPVYRVELRPDDGLYPLPYLARQADGRPWAYEGNEKVSDRAATRQTFLPDGERLFEEIDRLYVGSDGRANVVGRLADIDFFRSLPSGGGMRPTPDGAAQEAEVAGRDYFAYSPYHLGTAPPRPALAQLTNDIARIVAGGDYDGVLWTQGSPQIEETAYWLTLLIGTERPICCVAAQRRHGQMSADGPQNLVDAVRFIASGAWKDERGRNRCGVVALQDQQIFAARELYKSDARPGNYRASGGHGGIVGQVTQKGAVKLTYLPAFKHTWNSELRLETLPERAAGVALFNGRPVPIDIAIKLEGKLLESAIPRVAIVKEGGFSVDDWTTEPEDETDLLALIQRMLTARRLTGLVVEGLVPFGRLPSPPRENLLARAAYSGLPVVRVGRGAPEGFADMPSPMISGSNLTAIKARILLMAALMKLGNLPVAHNADLPTRDEVDMTNRAVAAYQEIFDTH